MVFFCKDVEGMTKRDLEVDSALDLFGKLEERGVLSPAKTTFLGKLLGDIARFDCLEMWEEYQRGLASSKDTKKDNPTSRKRRNDPEIPASRKRKRTPDPSDPEEYLSNKYLNGVLAPEITEEEQQVLGPELGFSRG
ncbi:uncharacterized protein LOC110982686 [Acanthaster planci]|uniref:Uncharacterized protein LOC110982686 n=1 Tax=Acanthaster planci TaxID=133434 RepID=A0A8B7Z0N6_ACAPL|nr:uncharacterized protein LOC110982686 [Acanthaster planci]